MGAFKERDVLSSPWVLTKLMQRHRGAERRVEMFKEFLLGNNIVLDMVITRGDL